MGCIEKAKGNLRVEGSVEIPAEREDQVDEAKGDKVSHIAVFKFHRVRKSSDSA